MWLRVSFFSGLAAEGSARGRFIFFAMNSESTSTSTKGGSVPLISCPCCGFPDLPTVEPETLHLEVGDEAVAGWLLPDGRLPVHAAGRVYLMPREAWTRYRALCASSAMTRQAMAA